MPNQPAGEDAAALKGPLHRYIVDLKVDPRWLSLESTPDGSHKATVEFVLAAYDNRSRPVNHVDKGFQVNIKPTSIPACCLQESPSAWRSICLRESSLCALPCTIWLLDALDPSKSP